MLKRLNKPVCVFHPEDRIIDVMDKDNISIFNDTLILNERDIRQMLIFGDCVLNLTNRAAHYFIKNKAPYGHYYTYNFIDRTYTGILINEEGVNTKRFTNLYDCNIWACNRNYAGNFLHLLIDSRLKYSFHKRVDTKHEHHLWYGGPVLTVKYRDYEIVIEAMGKVDFSLYIICDNKTMAIQDKDNAGILGKCLRNFLNGDYDLQSILETGPGHPLYSGHCINTNHWQYRIKNTEYPDDMIVVSSYPLLTYVIDHMLVNLDRWVEHIENKVRCNNCKSENLKESISYPKKWIKRVKYTCNNCDNAWHIDKAN